MPHRRLRFDDASTIFNGAVKLLRRDLGVTAFGIQVFDFPPGGRGIEHDESSTGQEEVYVGLAGSGWIEVDGERVPLEPRVAVAIPAGTPRRTYAGEEGLSYLCVGGVPGDAYHAVERFS
jgi:quercetin dioxygenase-like cupin family protein